ncbi:glycoside hydrolase family 19 protein, partial [Pseudomonas sp. KHB2.9]
DQGDFVKITRRINGGTNGQADRQALYDKALKVLA